MTDTLFTATTQPAPSVLPFDKNTRNDAGYKVKPKKDEDSDGVIQCICNFPGDDGYTVECEECQTWQHIACYYPGRKALEEEFSHSCVDCKPREHRELDIQKAVERMQAKLGPTHVDEEPHDKRTKRAPSKSHKKKAKPTDLQLNGHAVGNDSSIKHGSPHDQPPMKKAKTSHKPSQSTSSAPAKRSPSHIATTKVNHHGHPLSPATTPPDVPIDFESHPIVPQSFVSHGTPFVIADNNINATLVTQNKMAEWARPGCPDFHNDTKAEFDEVVETTTPSPLVPPLQVVKQDYQMPGGGTIPLHRLETPSAIDTNVPMIELLGVVGLQQEYCRAPENGYKDLSAPLPFVFFPERIPLYIDARRQGSIARHVRRSCRPNARLATYYFSLTQTWHFWLVSDRPIAANEEITLDWEFHLEGNYNKYMQRLLGLDGELGNENTVADVVASIDEKDYIFLDQWIALLMNYYGACACNRDTDCAFAQFRSLYNDKKVHGTGAKRKRAKSKPHTISPTSTGQATNSRAPSEGHLDDVSGNDDGTTPGSALYDKSPILNEVTEREKRKFEALEHQQQPPQPPRKKKKSIAEVTANKNVTKSRRNGSISHTSGKLNGADRAGGARVSVSNAGSPASAASPASPDSDTNAVSRQHSVASDSRRSTSSGLRSYCDTSVQTEPEPQPSVPLPPPRKVVSLTMRLMRQRRQTTHSDQSSASTLVDAPIKSSHSSPMSVFRELPPPSPSPAHADANAHMATAEAHPLVASPQNSSALLENIEKTGLLATPVKDDPSDLPVHVPHVPVFTSPTSVTTTTTPMSANGSLRSPLSTTIPPSPLVSSAEDLNAAATIISPVKEKKKLSMAEYWGKKSKKEAVVAANAPAKSPIEPEQTTGSTQTQGSPQASSMANGDQRANGTDNAANSMETDMVPAAVPAT